MSPIELLARNLIEYIANGVVSLLMGRLDWGIKRKLIQLIVLFFNKAGNKEDDEEDKEGDEDNKENDIVSIRGCKYVTKRNKNI